MYSVTVRLCSNVMARPRSRIRHGSSRRRQNGCDSKAPCPLHASHNALYAQCIVDPSVPLEPSAQSWLSQKVEKCSTFSAATDPSSNQIAYANLSTVTRLGLWRYWKAGKRVILHRNKQEVAGRTRRSDLIGWRMPLQRLLPHQSATPSHISQRTHVVGIYPTCPLHASVDWCGKA